MLPRTLYSVILPLLHGAPFILLHAKGRPIRSLSSIDPTPVPSSAPVGSNLLDTKDKVDTDSDSVTPSAPDSDSLVLPNNDDHQKLDAPSKLFPSSASFTLVNFPKLLEDDIGENKRDDDTAEGPEFEVSSTTPTPTSTSTTPKPAAGNPLSELSSCQINYLVAPGEKVKILSNQAAVIVDVLISALPKPNARAANKLSKILSDSRNQPEFNFAKFTRWRVSGGES